MRFVQKFETEDEIMVIIALEKENLKIPLAQEIINVNDLSEEQILGLIKDELNR